MKYVVGINLPIKSRCHEAGVALIDFDGNILFAANEERFSRKKLDGDFPERSIQAMFDQTGVDKDAIAYVAVPTLSTFRKMTRFAGFLFRERKDFLIKPETYLVLFRLFAKNAGPFRGKQLKNQEQEAFVLRYFWKDFIQEHFPSARICFVDHHLAHAAGAYFTSPWDEALIVTVDGAGNMRTSIVAEGKGGKISLLASTLIPHSLGTFWGSITKVCGFASGTRHGGKVTGLAARGNAKILIEKMRDAVWSKGLRVHSREELFFSQKRLVPNWASYDPETMKHYLGEASREDVAAAAQMRLEEVVVDIVSRALSMYSHKYVVCGGGVFANVLLNEKILAIDGVEDIFIFPAMSDGGLSVGAALYTLSTLQTLKPRRLPVPYFGPAYSNEEIERELVSHGISFEKLDAPCQKVAELIHGGSVVALFQGRMEYGPRALGNRSILYAPKDPSVNDWLNHKLQRSEFMPFAPVTLVEYASHMYEGISDDPIAATFMTITYQCTEKMKTEAPACVHVDGTARPQIIRRKDNPYYYDIINEYRKLSGISTLINTSFNMHEEPIVCSPEDAVRAFFASKIDYLVMENYLVSYEKNKDVFV